MEAPSMGVPVLPGQVVAGKYHVERVLGTGGMGVVMLATHRQLDAKVALKFLRPEAAARPGVVDRFLREARATARIKSEHVARVLDVGTVDAGGYGPVPFLVMEYLDGRDLGEVLAGAVRLPVAQAVDYVLEACEAVAEAHARGIVHRDLKPENLFLVEGPDGRARVKVIDFGISKVLAEELSPDSGAALVVTQASEVFGSPMYMAPEQLRCARDVDARADVWALGVVLFEVLAGHRPYRCPTVAELCAAVLAPDPVPWLPAVRPDVPSALEAVVARCLEKDRARRYRDASALAEALAPFGTASGQLAAVRGARWGGGSPPCADTETQNDPPVFERFAPAAPPSSRDRVLGKTMRRVPPPSAPAREEAAPASRPAERTHHGVALPELAVAAASAKPPSQARATPVPLASPSAETAPSACAQATSVPPGAAHAVAAPASPLQGVAPRAGSTQAAWAWAAASHAALPFPLVVKHLVDGAGPRDPTAPPEDGGAPRSSSEAVEIPMQRPWTALAFALVIAAAACLAIVALHAE